MIFGSRIEAGKKRWEGREPQTEKNQYGRLMESFRDPNKFPGIIGALSGSAGLGAAAGAGAGLPGGLVYDNVQKSR